MSMPQRLRIVRNKQTDQIQESRVRAGHWPELRFVAIPGWCESADRALSPRPCHDIGGAMRQCHLPEALPQDD